MASSGDVIELVIYLCKSNLIFLPYFSLFLIIYIRRTEKIPDSYDKCEPGFNAEIRVKSSKSY